MKRQGTGTQKGTPTKRSGATEERDAYEIEDVRRIRIHFPGELIPGDLFDERYVIREVIGKGGMGVVYSAFDTKLERAVAIKLFRSGAQAEDTFENELLKESKALAKLDSHNIVSIHDARRWEENSYLVMDLVAGTDLGNVLQTVRAQLELEGRSLAQRTGRDLERAICLPRSVDRANLIAPKSWHRTTTRIVHSIARTLELAHQQGICHRDIKPRNILLVGGGEPVLLDFGLAAARSIDRQPQGDGATTDGSDGEGLLRCTPAYVPPERAEGFCDVADPQGDVYQIGLVLYEFLTLQQAFPREADESFFALRKRILEANYPAPTILDPRIPAELAAIAAKALARQPKERYLSVRELREDLERVLDGLPPRIAKLGRRDTAWILARHAAWSPPAAVFAILLLGFLSWWGFNMGSEWTPPDLDPFLHHPTDGPQLVGTRTVLELKGLSALGLRIHAEDPAFFYVFASEENDQGLRYLRPVQPQRLGSASAPPPQQHEPLRLEAGEHWIACSSITGKSKREGLLVLACRERNPIFSEWLRTVAAKEDVYLRPVEYADARDILTDLQARSRGESLSKLSSEQWSYLFSDVQAASSETDAHLRIPGIRLHEFEFDVHAKKEDAE